MKRLPLLKREHLLAFSDPFYRDNWLRFLFIFISMPLTRLATNYVARRLRICYGFAVCRVANNFADYIVDAIFCLVF